MPYYHIDDTGWGAGHCLRVLILENKEDITTEPKARKERVCIEQDGRIVLICAEINGSMQEQRLCCCKATRRCVDIPQCEYCVLSVHALGHDLLGKVKHRTMPSWRL